MRLFDTSPLSVIYLCEIYHFRSRGRNSTVNMAASVLSRIQLCRKNVFLSASRCSVFMKNTYLVKSNENDECRLEFLDGDNEGKLFVYISELTSYKLKSKFYTWAMMGTDYQSPLLCNEVFQS